MNIGNDAICSQDTLDQVGPTLSYADEVADGREAQPPLTIRRGRHAAGWTLEDFLRYSEARCMTSNTDGDGKARGEQKR